MQQAYLFPGQGVQFPGMGHDLYQQHTQARELFEQANEVLGFRLTDYMFAGSAEALLQTRVTQPAVFAHAVVLAKILPELQPAALAGHSLGELAALVVGGVLTFTDGLQLVAARAQAMQTACEQNPGTMAAIVGLPSATTELVCSKIDEQVWPANYNTPQQTVISGTMVGVERASVVLQEAGAKRVVPLAVSGAFHTPLMQPAREALATAVRALPFAKAQWPIYQNATAQPTQDPAILKQNLLDQLTAPVRWAQSLENMQEAGINDFCVCGPGKVVQGLVNKTLTGVTVTSIKSVDEA